MKTELELETAASSVNKHDRTWLSVKTEADLASALVSQIERAGWAVFQERIAGIAGDGAARADIYAMRMTEGGEIEERFVFETKMAFGLSVMKQALRWIDCKRYVVVPSFRRYRDQSIARLLCKSINVGLCVVNPRGSVTFLETATMATPIDGAQWQISATELDAMSGSRFAAKKAAGSPGGGYDTAFGRTVRCLAELVAADPGRSLPHYVSKLIEAGQCHYSSPKVAVACLQKLARHGKLRGIESRGIGRNMSLRPADVE